MLITYKHQLNHSAKVSLNCLIWGIKENLPYTLLSRTLTVTVSMAVLQTSSMRSGTLCKQFHHLDVSTSKKRRTSPLHFTIQGLTSKLQKKWAKLYSDENWGCRGLSTDRLVSNPSCCDHFPTVHYWYKSKFKDYKWAFF